MMNIQRHFHAILSQQRLSIGITSAAMIYSLLTSRNTTGWSLYGLWRASIPGHDSVRLVRRVRGSVIDRNRVVEPETGNSK
jgi:hypothetical protein